MISGYLRLALLLAAVPGAAAAQDRPVVRTVDGPVRGATEGGIVAFKGIPFAAPPVGALRWRAPQPVARWTAVRDATAYAADCMQLPFPSDAAPLGTAPAEDCLYANVWRPAGDARKLPVMVWIYGGGFVNGGSSPPTYSGAALARSGILVMSFNYRLGRFGSFAHPGLKPADADYGLLDQLAALRWVKANIARFGGDPGNVTIIGESAGGMSVHAMLSSPAAAGLFQRAVVQSGGDGSSHGVSLATAEAAGVGFASGKGIAADDPQAAAKLRALPAEQVVDGLNLASMGQGGYSGPVPDGRTFVDARAAYDAGRFAKVPVMIGATSADIGGPTGPMIAGARDVAALLASKGVPVYHYRFDYVATSAQTPQTKGAGHATDIPFFFDTAAIKYGAATSDTDRAAARTISRYLVNFVKTGDPNGPDLPAWGRYTATARPMLTLTRAGTAQVAPE
ncbi:carboxylesterase family protein [Sphingomonas sp. CD22]|uniref:carboxylesterase/lipase family protein n=1 Tax=Sphingomonas sp. CD22 TaxID=3100214 RepID=UPI002AE0544B|nr:carboxylesterase family protein [Sphingomonas sp. CD22]MEA1084956.1 carboxylesterase family protein [Sphingomonas sp. CD22]